MIYCVEDDQSIRDPMVYTLKTAGYEVIGLETGDDLFEAMKHHRPDLILLDIMLPGADGIEILKALRQRTDNAQIPVILASAKGSEYDKILGLDLGADDYLAKPFGMMEMVSRVRAVLRRAKPDSDDSSVTAILQNGDITINTLDHAVTVAGNPVQLTLKEYDILHLLMKNPGRVFTREQLLDQVWGVEFIGESRTVDVHIGTLRNKLSECARMIITVRGVGYKMEKR